jgi:rubrerythrin
MTASREHSTTAAGGDESPLLAAGDHGKGEFRCVDCGHTVTICRELRPCPMCGCESWETVAWSPFARALETSAVEAHLHR